MNGVCVCSHVCVFVNSVLEQMFLEGVCMCDAAALLSACAYGALKNTSLYKLYIHSVIPLGSKYKNNGL